LYAALVLFELTTPDLNPPSGFNIPVSEFDVYVITTVGDRLDLLAYQFYRDSTLWWVISMANNNVTKGLIHPEPGTQLRIPTDLNAVLALFNNFNQAR